MKCARCDENVDPGWSVCPVCGEAVRQACPQCGQEAMPHWRICPACRHPLRVGERDIAVGPAAPKPEPAAKFYESSWAVVVGIDAYQHLPALECAVADAQAVAELLPTLGFQADRIIALFDEQASADEIRYVLDDRLRSCTAPGDRVVVFYAGHGVDRDLPDGSKEGYLCPVAAQRDRIGATCIRMSAVRDWSRAIPAKHVLYLMDCCYSGLAALPTRRVSAQTPDYLRRITQAPVRHIITAGGSGDRAAEQGGHGLFTRKLIDALRGAADLEGRGYVTGEMLGAFLKERVSNLSAGGQTPVSRQFDGEGEVVFVLSPEVVAPASAGVADAASDAAPQDEPKAQPARDEPPREPEPDPEIAELRKQCQADAEEANAASMADREEERLKELAAERGDTWRRGAKAGIPEARWLMGARLRYEADARGDDALFREAYGWLSRAAQQGYADAESDVGYCYLAGQGVSENHGEAVKWFRRAVGKGSGTAMAHLGNCHLEGKGVAEDHGEAARWFERAARKGDLSGLVNLGYCYYEGCGVPEDKETAVEWFRRAAARGSANAQRWLASCYDDGEGVPQDHAEAVKWYRAAADAGSVPAQVDVGHCYYFGKGTPKDLAEAARWFRRAADQGNAYGQYLLGLCFDKGEGVEEDPVKAAEHYRKAAEQGHAGAQDKLGMCQWRNWTRYGLPYDATTAMEWIGKAAEQGLAAAQYHLGWYWESMRDEFDVLHEEPDEEYAVFMAKAAEHYRKAAEQGLAAAQERLARLYEQGCGVPKDLAEAETWYAKAAENGDADAQFRMGVRRYQGKGVDRDRAAAAEWFRKAADQGHAKAQHNLAICYEAGKGVARDRGQAREWFRKAADQGIEEAKKKLDEL